MKDGYIIIDEAIWQKLSHYIDERRDEKIIDLINKNHIGINEINAEGSVLIYAANFGRNQLILELIRIGADVNLSIKESGVTPLHAAASQNLPETGRILIENGANINAQSAMAVRSKFFYSPHCSETALHLAAAYCDKEFISLLLESGADRQKKDGIGATPIDYLRRHRNSNRDIEQLKDLIENFGTDLFDEEKVKHHRQL